MRILLAEDSSVYQRLISDHLREWGFELILTADGTEAWELLQQTSGPKLALLDWMLPGLDGIEICRKIRSRSKSEPYVYTVLLTAKNSKQDLLHAMEAGADDFLAKPFDELELKARLFAGQRILDLQEQLVSTRESLRFAATHDSLTGMWNRTEILSFLAKELARAKRECSSVGIALADIDHFKQINDTLGHLAGDAALRQVAKTLCANLRVYDGAGRYGGEEFLLVLPGCDLETLVERAGEIRRLVAQTVVETSDSTIATTVSIGVIEAKFDADLPLGEWLQLADQALYRAKHKGRNCVEGIPTAPSVAASWIPVGSEVYGHASQIAVRGRHRSGWLCRDDDPVWRNRLDKKHGYLLRCRVPS